MLDPFCPLAAELKERIVTWLAVIHGKDTVCQLALVCQDISAVCRHILYREIVVGPTVPRRLNRSLKLHPSRVSTIKHVTILGSAFFEERDHLVILLRTLAKCSLIGFHSLAYGDHPNIPEAPSGSHDTLSHLSLCGSYSFSLQDLSKFVRLRNLRIEGTIQWPEPLPETAPPVRNLTMARLRGVECQRLLTYLKDSLESIFCRFTCASSLHVNRQWLTTSRRRRVLQIVSSSSIRTTRQCDECSLLNRCSIAFIDPGSPTFRCAHAPRSVGIIVALFAFLVADTPLG